MTLNEYINMQNRLNSIMKVYSQPLINFQNQINKSVVPLVNTQKQISKVFESMNLVFDQYKSSNLLVNQTYTDLINKHQQILSKLTYMDSSHFVHEISPGPSLHFSEVTLDIINKLDLNDEDAPDEFIEAKENIIGLTKPKPAITLEQVLAIISLIITLLTFVQSEQPDKQLSSIESSLQQLIDIETKELELLKERAE